MKRPIPEIKNKKRRVSHKYRFSIIARTVFVGNDENGNKVIKCQYGTLTVRGNVLRCHNPNLVFTTKMTRAHLKLWYKKVNELLGDE